MMPHDAAAAVDGATRKEKHASRWCMAVQVREVRAAALVEHQPRVHRLRVLQVIAGPSGHF